jgi:hypothetical protein
VNIDTTRLSDTDLVAEVKRLARCESEATAALIGHLAELYGRRLHESAGFPSLFAYCVEALSLSDSASYDRMKAAKVVRRYPSALALLVSGRLNLTTIRLLAPHLTRANHVELLAAAAGMRKRQVQKLLAERFPQPDVRSSVRKLPTVARAITSNATAAATVAPAAPRLSGPEEPMRDAGPVSTSGRSATGATVPAPRPAVVQPLSADRYRVTFTASTAACEKLELATDLLRHAFPGGDPAQIFERALDVLVAKLVKDKFAVTNQPRASSGQSDRSRNIPAEVKRAVYIRDRGRCAFIGTTGRTCGERGFVEFHHVEPYEAGGSPTPQNIALRCRAHNSYEAELFYGPGKQYGGADIARERPVGPRRVMDDTFSFRNESDRSRHARVAIPR